MSSSSLESNGDRMTFNTRALSHNNKTESQGAGDSGLLVSGPGAIPTRVFTMTRRYVRTAAVALSVFLLTGPAAAGQTSMLAAPEATAFMGTWLIAMENPRGGGTRDQTVVIRDEGGKTAAKIEGGRGGALDVTNIARDGDSLVLSFERSVRGRTIPIVLTLTVDGEMINATQNVGDGRFTVSGSGKKQ